MNIRSRPTADETRERILTVAEEMFRRVGYAKTAVADIAAELGMSPANIYRYFPSKSAINDALCHRLLDSCHEVATAIVRGPGTAEERARALILGIYRHNKAMLTHERRIFDMVEVAISENWVAVSNHIDFIGGLWAELIAGGIAEGAFDPELDPATTARSVLSACCRFHHPTLIAQCQDEDPEATLAALADLVLRALARR